MRQKLPLLIGICALLIIVGVLAFRHTDTKTSVERSKIEGTCALLRSGSTTTNLKKYAVNFFMENSASMDGYVNGTTEFKDVLGKMIVSAHHYCKGADLYFVNNQVYKAGDNAVSFIQMLNPSKIHVGNVTTTDVNQIFRNILNRTSKDTISVLFSDCIYSVKNVQNELDNAKNATTDAFLTALNRNPSLATIILQLKSKFDGFYYDRYDHPMSCQHDRPFYVVITGNKDALKEIYKKFKIEELPGLQNKCFLSSESYTLDENSACSIISDYTNARRIKTDKHNFLDIESIDLDREQSDLVFAIGVDANSLFVGDSEMLDAQNYTVEPEDYKVIGVEKASPSAKGDFMNMPTNPYAIKIKVPTDRFAPMVTIGLSKNTPSWVKKSNVIDDAGMVPGATQSFAIQKMVEGISNAYNTDYSHTFKIQVNINKYNR